MRSRSPVSPIATAAANTADSTMNTGNNHMQTDERGQHAAGARSQRRHARLVQRVPHALRDDASRPIADTTTGSTTTSMTSSYSITFTVNNPTGATGPDRHRHAARRRAHEHHRHRPETARSRSARSQARSNAVTQAALALAVRGPDHGRRDGNVTAVQPGQHDALDHRPAPSRAIYVLQFDWSSSADERARRGAIRMGLGRRHLEHRADDYPGATFPRDATQQSNDGHFVDVRATIIARRARARDAAACVALGLLALAVRRSRARKISCATRCRT